MSDDSEFTATCKECGQEYDIESEGSDEVENLCFACEEYFFCVNCGVELCKPSECGQGGEFKCSCGVIHRRRGDKMIISGGPEDQGPFESPELNDVIEGEQRITHVLNDIHTERLRQNNKWGRKPGEWNKSPFLKLTVLAEEFGEVAEALLERRPIPDLKKELIQVAAVAAAWAEDCDSGVEKHGDSTMLDFKKLERVNEQTPRSSVVILIDDSGDAHITFTRSEPWKLGDGTLVVKVNGRTGGYRADRCHVLSRQGDPE